MSEVLSVAKNELELLSNDQQKIIEELFGCSASELITSPTEHGNMSYLRSIIKTPDGQQFFMKCIVPERYYDDDNPASYYIASELRHLDNEARALMFLNEQMPGFVPQVHKYDRDAKLLVTEYLPDQWVAPTDPDQLKLYWESVSGLLKKIQTLPIPDWVDKESPSLKRIKANSWGSFDFSNFPDDVREICQVLEPRGLEAVARCRGEFLTHHDARPENIGWNPKTGEAHIIDPSWFGLGPKNADTTMFLISLAASGIDVSEFINEETFNPDYALVRAGWLLSRSSRPESKFAKPGMRESQLRAALSAIRLIM